MKSERTKQRLDKMLNVDREELNEPTRAAVILEFNRVAKEFFETQGISLNLKKLKSGTEVTVSFRAVRVKNFSTLK